MQTRQSDGHVETWGTWSSAGRRGWPRKEPSLLMPGPGTVSLLDIHCWRLSRGLSLASPTVPKLNKECFRSRGQRTHSAIDLRAVGFPE